MVATFDGSMAALPFNPTTDDGTGFLPPVMRAMGHLLALASRLSDTKIKTTPTEITSEIADAAKHWASAQLPKGTMSSSSINRAQQIAQAMKELSAESKDWDATKTAEAARNLCNRVAQYMAELDRELLGLRSSDPGNTL